MRLDATGPLEVSGGTFDLRSSLSIGALEVADGTFNLYGQSTIGALTLSSGTADLSDTSTIGTLDVSGGTLSGTVIDLTGTTTVEEDATWTVAAGTSDAGVATVTSITNNGTVTLDTGAALDLTSGSRFTNDGSAVVGLGATLTSTTLDGSFINDNTVTGEGGTVSVPFTNNGTVANLVFQPVDPLSDPALAVILAGNSTIVSGEFGDVTLNVGSDLTATLNNATFIPTTVEVGGTPETLAVVTTITGGGTLELTGTTDDYVPNLLLDGADVTNSSTGTLNLVRAAWWFRQATRGSCSTPAR